MLRPARRRGVTRPMRVAAAMGGLRVAADRPRSAAGELELASIWSADVQGVARRIPPPPWNWAEVARGSFWRREWQGAAAGVAGTASRCRETMGRREM
jgi:hypothetical protein